MTLRSRRARDRPGRRGPPPAGSSRWRSTPPAAGAADLHVPRPRRARRPRARRGGPRRVRAAPGARDRRRRDGRPPAAAPRPIVDRVRADGPLLPPLGLALGALDRRRTTWRRRRSSCGRCCRPGLLERLELVAERAPGDRRRGRRPVSERAPDRRTRRPPRAARPRPAAGPRPRRAGRPGRPAAPAPRRSRPTGVVIARVDAARRGRRPALRALDPAHRGRPGGRDARGRASGRPADRSARARPAALAELAAGAAGEVPAAELAGRHGTAAVAGLVRRGLVGRRGPRAAAPAARRAAGRAARRPARRRATSCRPRRTRSTRIRAAIAARDPRPLLLDGVTGAGKTAIYVEAIAASLEAGRPALVLVPEIALALPLVDRLRADLDARIALAPLRASATASGPTSGAGSGRATSTSSSGRGWRSPPRSPTSAWSSSTRSTTPPTRATGRRGSRPATPRSGSPRWPARRVVLGSATPAVDSVGRAATGDVRPGRSCRSGRSGAPPTVEVVDLREELAAGQRGLLSRSLVARARRRSTRPPATRRSSSSTGAAPRRSCSAATAATSRPARTASGRSSTTRPARRCAAITAAGRRRSRRAARPAARRGSATSAAARSGSSARSARRSRASASAGSIATSSSTAARPSGSSTRSPTGRLDVLVGTSLVAKGLDIPTVTLVGVVSSDVALNLPDERAAERTYQLLVQAIGRAGRGARPGHAIVQTYQPDHPAILAAATGRPRRVLRRRAGAAPAVRLAAVRAARQADGRPGRPARRRARGDASMAERLRALAAGPRRRRHRRRAGARLHRPARRSLALERRPPRRRSGRAARRRPRRAVVGRRRSGVAALIGDLRQMTGRPVRATMMATRARSRGVRP